MNESTGVRATGGKHLGFRLGDERFAIDVFSVREIIEPQRVTKVPRTPAHVLGMINLRGKIVPVVDLRKKLGLPADGLAGKEVRIVVVDLDDVRTGVVVDAVSEVLEIAESQIEAPPHFGDGADVEFLRGIAKVKNGVYLIMDVRRVLSTEDVIELSRLTRAATTAGQGKKNT